MNIFKRRLKRAVIALFGLKTTEKQDYDENNIIGWVFQFGILINQKDSFLGISRKTELKSAALSVTELISLFYRTMKEHSFQSVKSCPSV